MLDLVIPHFATNEGLAQGPKIFVRRRRLLRLRLDGNKYFDSFATLLTTVCGHTRPEVTAAVHRQMQTLEFFSQLRRRIHRTAGGIGTKARPADARRLAVSFFVNSGSEANEDRVEDGAAISRGLRPAAPLQGCRPARILPRRDAGRISVTGLSWFREYFEPLIPGCIFAPGRARPRRPAGVFIGRLRHAVPAAVGGPDPFRNAGDESQQ